MNIYKSTPLLFPNPSPNTTQFYYVIIIISLFSIRLYRNDLTFSRMNKELLRKEVIEWSYAI